MDLKQLKSIMSLFEHSAANKLEVSEGDGVKTFSVKMEKGFAVQGEEYVAPRMTVRRIEESDQTPVGKDGTVTSDEGVLDYNLLGEVKSPMVGIFYAASDPESPPYVQKGDKVKKGDTLCLIEAMKLMNEVVAERDGEVVDICVENGSLVEFGQVLFKIF